jgi:hypothetical protein
MENKEQMTEEQLKEAMLQENQEMEKKYDELFEELDKGGYFKQTYSKDSMVTIPGGLFNSFIYFCHIQGRNLHQIQGVLNMIQQTVTGLGSNVSDMTIRLMEQHKQNVDSGLTISTEEMDEEDAKENIKEIIVEDKPKKKTRIKTASLK